MKKFNYTSGFAKFEHGGHEFLVEFVSDGLQITDLSRERIVVKISGTFMHMLSIHAEKSIQEWKLSPEFEEIFGDDDRGNNGEKEKE